MVPSLSKEGVFTTSKQVKNKSRGSQRVILSVCHQDAFMNVNVEDLQQGANRWQHSRTGRKQTATEHI